MHKTYTNSSQIKTKFTGQRRGSRHQVSPLTTELFATDSYGRIAFSSAVTLAISTTLQGRPQAQEQLIKTKMDSMYFCFLFLFCCCLVFSPLFLFLFYWFFCFVLVFWRENKVGWVGRKGKFGEGKEYARNILHAIKTF